MVSMFSEVYNCYIQVVDVGNGEQVVKYVNLVLSLVSDLVLSSIENYYVLQYNLVNVLCLNEQFSEVEDVYQLFISYVLDIFGLFYLKMFLVCFEFYDLI